MKPFPISKKILVAYCRRNHISFIGVFGSFVKGEQTSRSDIDLLVKFSKRISLLDLIRIERELTERIGRKVDLLTEASISPYLRERIIKETVTIYEEKT